ncbi:MAG TPA: neutral/alkaline non-lysosomal ceramidase N-terminal domain-containing protein [Solimonas sp.]|nr:neutral/alkaline non-lysosomal ceramidase N-terminal domain-containing protein [Solimonas sp.]
MSRAWVPVFAASGLLLSACGQSQPLAGQALTPTPEPTPAQLPAAAACVLHSPLLQVGTSPTLTLDGVTYTNAHQPDAPSAIELPLANVGTQPAGACRGNGQYRFGSGLYDMTGPIGGNPTGHADLFGMVVPPQVPNGIHLRLYARAFAIESPCNGKRVMFVSDDLGAISALLHQEILAAVAADPALAPLYNADNVMLSSTHTHNAGGGFGVPVLPDESASLPALINTPAVWLESLVFSNANYDDDNFRAIVDGTVRTMRRAHANLEAHPQAASIRLAVSQLLNANINRSPPAYQQNAASERGRDLDLAGHEVNVDKRVVQVNFIRPDGSAAGVINWFAVHPTSMSNHALLISSDNKGHAALGFEQLMGTRYQPDGVDPAGADNFVAAFAQTDEGDTVPDLFVFDPDVDGGNGPGQGVPYYVRGGTLEPYEFEQPGYMRGQQEATAINGTKQLAAALAQFGQGTALSGPVDFRFFYADFSADEITDPEVLAQLQAPDSPDNLYDGAKTTCGTALGVGFGVGGVNGPGFGAAGFTCNADAPSPYLDQIRNGYNGLYNGTGYVVVEQDNTPLQVPFNGVAATTVAAPVLCTVQRAEPQYACQDEKPVLFPSDTNPVPFQLFRIGNLAVLGVPFEVTTMSGRRLRKTVLDALSPVGIDTVVIAGMANDYLHYLATREEYSAQMYEGASTYAGPWELAAVQQESRKLALSLANGEAAPAGLPAAVLSTGPASPITVDSPADFGSVVTDALASYAQGDTVDVSFVSGYPGNDLKTMSSYLYVERRDAAGLWQVVAIDGRPELNFIWNSSPSLLNSELNQSGPSTAQALWKIPRNTPAGTYRIRHEGVSRLSASEPPALYEGISSAFEVVGAAADCP